jgi:hypothetical protein
VDIPEYIAQLGDADARVRLRAAGDIFDLGTRLCDPILEKWLADEELAGLLVRVEGEVNVPGAAGDGPPRLRPSARSCAATVGIAVQPGTFEKVREANGEPELARVPPDQDAMEFELEFSGHVRIDVLTTDAPGGTGADSALPGEIRRRDSAGGVRCARCGCGEFDTAAELWAGTDLSGDPGWGERDAGELFPGGRRATGGKS